MKKNPKLICKNVWKLFGNNPKDFLLKHNNNPSDDTIIIVNSCGDALKDKDILKERLGKLK